MKPKLAISFLLLLGLMPILPAEEEKEPPFLITGMKCFSDKIINKAEVGKSGFKLEAGFRVGTTSEPGSEIPDFTFPEDQKKQYFEFQFGPGSGGKMITARVNGAKTTAGVGYDIVTVSGKTDSEGCLPANWSLPKNWPIGLYKVYFTCEGQSVGTGNYLVRATKERKTPIEAIKVQIDSIVEDKAVDKATLTTADTALVFTCKTKGADTAGANVRMFIGSIDEKGEKTIVSDSEVTVEEWPLEDTSMVYSFNLPGGLAPGDYHMVYYVNEEMLVAHPFKVTKAD